MRAVPIPPKFFEVEEVFGRVQEQDAFRWLHLHHHNLQLDRLLVVEVAFASYGNLHYFTVRNSRGETDRHMEGIKDVLMKI